MYIRKKEGKVVKAWQLGSGSAMEDELIAKGKLRYYPDEDIYELMSQESQSGSGEFTESGVFFKVDNAGYPYPQGPHDGSLQEKIDWFYDNHNPLGGDDWEQIPKPLYAWDEEDGYDEDGLPPYPVKALLEQGLMELDMNSWEARYGAELWGSWLTADADAVIVFYDVDSLDFNFVARAEFDATYDIID